MILFNILLGIAFWNLLMSVVNKQQENKLFCGIVGFSGKTNFRSEKINQLLLWNAFERGEDAAGIYSPKNGLKKSAKHVKEFLLENTIEEDRLLIAHVRAKTIGINNDNNAHPFEEGNVILCHNGTLSNHYSLKKKYNLDDYKYDVDSHVICAIMAQEKNFKVLSEIDGGAAILINSKVDPDTLYVYRNDKRPLFKGYFDGNMYISSIEESLKLIGCINIKEFKPDFIYTIKKGLIVGIPYKVANKPYDHFTTTTNRWGTLPEVMGSLLRCDSVNISNYAHVKADLTFNKKYLITGYDIKKKELQVVDNNKETHWVNSHSFDLKVFMTEGDYVRTLGDLRKTSNKDNIDPDIKKGDVLLITRDKYTGTVNCLHLDTNEYYEIKKEYLEVLTPAEKLFYTGPQQNEQTSLGFPEGSFNIDESINHNCNCEEEDINTSQEDDDEFYDLQVNEEELIKDFIKIDEVSQKFYKFAADFIPDEHLEKFNSLRAEMETQLLHCSDYYTQQTNA